MEQKIAVLLRWIETHQKKIWIFLGSMVGVFILAAAGSAWLQHRQAVASNDLMTLLQETDAQKRTEGLNQFVQKHRSQHAADLARWELAESYFQAEDWEKAQKQFAELYQHASQSLLRVTALHGMGDVALAQKDFKKATESFDRAAMEPKNLVADLSRFRAARTLVSAKQWNEAELRLKELAAKEKLSPELKQSVQTELLWVLTQK